MTFRIQEPAVRVTKVNLSCSNLLLHLLAAVTTALAFIGLKVLALDIFKSQNNQVLNIIPHSLLFIIQFKLLNQVAAACSLFNKGS